MTEMKATASPPWLLAKSGERGRVSAPWESRGADAAPLARQSRGDTLLALHAHAHLALDLLPAGHAEQPGAQAERQAQRVEGRADQQQEVQPGADVADVIEVISQLAAHAVDAGVRRQLDLGQPGHAGAHRQPLAVARAGALQLGQEL